MQKNTGQSDSSKQYTEIMQILRLLEQMEDPSLEPNLHLYSKL